jgi:hypothetical protein
VAQPQALGSDDVSARRFTDKVDRNRDVPAAIRTPLKRAVAAVYAAYEEDKDELSLTEPSMDSFKGLLKFLSHPHRADWMAPSLALNPEGHFVAVWDIVPCRYSVEFLSPDNAHWISVIRSYDQIEHDQGDYRLFDIFLAPPFRIPRRGAAA